MLSGNKLAHSSSTKLCTLPFLGVREIGFPTLVIQDSKYDEVILKPGQSNLPIKQGHALNKI